MSASSSGRARRAVSPAGSQRSERTWSPASTSSPTRRGSKTRSTSVELVVTGEGKLDATSFDGKTVGGVLDLAADAGVPNVAVIAGQVTAEAARSSRYTPVCRCWRSRTGCGRAVRRSPRVDVGRGSCPRSGERGARGRLIRCRRDRVDQRPVRRRQVDGRRAAGRTLAAGNRLRSGAPRLPAPARGDLPKRSSPTSRTSQCGDGSSARPLPGFSATSTGR